jgi:release factor glutamine methyltransferase
VFVYEVVEKAKKMLQEAGIPAVELEVAVIVANRLKTTREQIFLNRDRKITALQYLRIMNAIRKRAKSMPVAYIVGYKDFYRDRIKVSHECLIPRSDTEHLIYAIEAMNRDFDTILEFGTGSGAISIALSRLFPNSQIIATDIKTKSARRNIRALGIKNIAILKHDMFSDKPVAKSRFDLIVSNPPYLSKEDTARLSSEVKDYEPHLALYGGEDGLDFYRRLAEICLPILNRDGKIVLEADYKYRGVIDIFEKAGFIFESLHRDYGGLERVIVFAVNPR